MFFLFLGNVFFIYDHFFILHWTPEGRSVAPIRRLSDAAIRDAEGQIPLRYLGRRPGFRSVGHRPVHNWLSTSLRHAHDTQVCVLDSVMECGLYHLTYPVVKIHVFVLKFLLPVKLNYAS